MSTFVNSTIKNGLVAPSSVAVLNKNISCTNQWKEAWLPEIVFVSIAALLTFSTHNLHLYGISATFYTGDVSESGMAHQWYLLVCLTLFRFLMLRWIWHLGMWCFMLWRISRLELHLIPTHPDGAAGLGYLEVVHCHFTPLVFALSSVQAAMLAEEISFNHMEFAAIYPPILFVLILNALLFLGPLFIFAPRLWACKVKGLDEYMILSSEYVKDFDTKWLRNKTSTQDQLLGTPDLQSLADLNNSISVVRNMRWVPISLPLLVTLISAALVPMLPLLLLKYPMTELAEKFFTSLMGF